MATTISRALTDPNWWRHAVIYQIYPRSFADGNGDGIGDLPGIIDRIPHLADLGVDAIWLSPFYPSPQKDAGYDVSNYCDVEPIFGTLKDAEVMFDRAHELGMRVIIDIVPNHSSDQHEWFQAALKAGPGSRERARYIFREGKGENGELPPNNWVSQFGGPAWSRITEADGQPGQWYLHLFDSTQPDFDWNNPEVAEFFRDVMSFWLEKGADGFRVDVAHGMVKEAGLPDAVLLDKRSLGDRGPAWDQDGVHEIFRDWRKHVTSFGEDRILCAEAWVLPLSKMAHYIRPDEMHQAFNFGYLATGWNGEALRKVIDESLEAFGGVGGPSTWVLSNHDVVRHASRFALEYAIDDQPSGFGPKSTVLPDAELGLKRARAATTLMLALPGSAYLYQGEELGLPDSLDIPDEFRQDPTFFRTNGKIYGRDGCRVPIPWAADEPAFGFNNTGESWLPQPKVYGELARDRQAGAAGSTLELYRSLLRARADYDLGTGSLSWLEGFPAEVVAFSNGKVTVVANTGSAPVELPAGKILQASGPLSGAEGRTLPTDTTVWLEREN